MTEKREATPAIPNQPVVQQTFASLVRRLGSSRKQQFALESVQRTLSRTFALGSMAMFTTLFPYSPGIVAMKMPGKETFGNSVVVHPSPARKARYPNCLTEPNLVKPAELLPAKRPCEQHKEGLNPSLDFQALPVAYR